MLVQGKRAVFRFNLCVAFLAPCKHIFCFQSNTQREVIAPCCFCPDRSWSQKFFNNHWFRDSSNTTIYCTALVWCRSTSGSRSSKKHGLLWSKSSADLAGLSRYVLVWHMVAVSKRTSWTPWNQNIWQCRTSSCSHYKKFCTLKHITKVPWENLIIYVSQGLRWMTFW